MRRFQYVLPTIQQHFDTDHPEYARPRPEGSHPELLVLHHTGGHYAGDWPILTGQTDRWVSVHYYVTRDGTVWYLTDEALRASHAGVSVWEGRHNVNDFSLGIEMESTGHNGYTDPQYWGTVWLCMNLCLRYHIPFEGVVGHKHIAPGRKWDPGMLNLEEFRAHMGRVLAHDYLSDEANIRVNASLDDIRL